MSVETLLAYALGIIGVLLTMLIGLVVYVFLSLKSDVRSVATEVGDLHRGRVKLVHRDDCRTTTERIQDKLDEHDDAILELKERMASAETALDLAGHC